MKSRTGVYFILVLVVLGALYLRLAGLSSAGLSFTEPIHIYAAKAIVQDGKPILPSGKVYDRSLLFTQSVALSFKLFGVNELSARLPSVAFGALTVIMVFFIGRHFFGAKAGLIAALLTAVMPFEIVWSRTCRMYAMYQFFFLCTFFAFYKGFEPKSEKRQKSPATRQERSARTVTPFYRDVHWGWLSASIVLLLIAFHLQPQVLLMGVSMVAYLFMMWIVSSVGMGLRESVKSKYFICLTLLIIVAAGMVTVPRVADEIRSLYEFSPTWAQNKGVSVLYYIQFLSGPILFPVLLFFILGALQVCTRMHKAGLYTVTAACVALVVHSFLVNTQSYRYIYDVFPLMLLISAYSLQSLWETESKLLHETLHGNLHQSKLILPLKTVLTVPLIFLLALPFSFAVNHAFKITRNQAGTLGGDHIAQWKEACRYVNGQINAGDVIVASIPLAADFYGCKNVSYSLDNGEIDQFIEIKESRFLRHPFANASTIVNFDDFRAVLLDHPRGWMVVDRSRFYSKNTPEDVREFIERNFMRHTATGATKTVEVFSWNQDVISLVRLDSEQDNRPSKAEAAEY